MKVEDRFKQFDYIVVRVLLAALLVLGAIKVAVPAVLEVKHIFLR